MNKQIVIIGAGASGIAAATKLLGAGFHNILILEAECRIGGRVNTIPFGANVVDLGAQWYSNSIVLLLIVVVRNSINDQLLRIGVMERKTT